MHLVYCGAKQMHLLCSISSGVKRCICIINTFKKQYIQFINIYFSFYLEGGRGAQSVHLYRNSELMNYFHILFFHLINFTIITFILLSNSPLNP